MLACQLVWQAVRLLRFAAEQAADEGLIATAASYDAAASELSRTDAAWLVLEDVEPCRVRLDKEE